MPPTALAPATSAQATAAPAAAAARGRVSPAARKAAAQLHVNLDVVEGRGPGGSITVADVERAAPVGKPAATTPDRLSGLRAAMAAAMAHAKREIPHRTIHDGRSRTSVDVAQGRERAAPRDGAAPASRDVYQSCRACVDRSGGDEWLLDRAGFPAGNRRACRLAIALRGGGLVAPGLHNVPQSILTCRPRVRRSREAGKGRDAWQLEISDATIT